MLSRSGWTKSLAILGIALSVVLVVAAFPGFGSAQTAPSLGTAESFAVLGGSTVTNTGTTTVAGDLGVWPGTAVTGFPPGVVVGTIYEGGAVAQQAQSDVTAAYNSLAGQACDEDLTGQDLGGMTLTSGVYCFSSSAQLTGQLTLDAEGDPGAVFIFQIGTTLTTASNSSIITINSGSHCNAFWQVGSSATLGTNTAFQGNILALASITLNTGASVDGRALARNEAVTMDSNNVTNAGCVAAEPTPGETPEPTPEATPGETPEPTPDATPGETPEATPDATPGETPEATPGETPEATPGDTPEATPGETPEATPEATPGETPETTPEATPGETPEATPEATPGDTPEATPESTPGPTPGSIKFPKTGTGGPFADGSNQLVAPSSVMLAIGLLLVGGGTVYVTTRRSRRE